MIFLELSRMIYIREIGILLVTILIIYGVYLYKFSREEGFTTADTVRGVGYDDLRAEALSSSLNTPPAENESVNNIHQEVNVVSEGDPTKLDLDLIRKQFSIVLSQADARSHDEPRSPERSSLRVGLERLITELDFMRSERGRFLVSADLEEMLLQTRQRLKAM
jgi:hypothetical protein